MINIVIPMAGLGSRFLSAGYKKAKPFIDVAWLKVMDVIPANPPLSTKLSLVFFFVLRKENFEVMSNQVEQVIFYIFR